MIVLDAVTFNVDRHAGNYGVLVNNDTGKLLGINPIFDMNLSEFPYLMQQDDVDSYYASQGPRLGEEFVSSARELMTDRMRRILIRLKDFEYEDPGHGYPEWKLKLLNRMKDWQINSIPGRGKTISFSEFAGMSTKKDISKTKRMI